MIRPSEAVRRLRSDVAAVRDRDPAAGGPLSVVLCYPGMWALWTHRVASRLSPRRPLAARVLATLARVVTGVDLHPAAEVGDRVVIDHGAGVVIGSTAEVGDDVHVFHGVTLGSRRATDGKRHPTVGDGALLGANATVLGPVSVGAGARVGAGAVVVDDVPPDTTAVGNPARIVEGGADGVDAVGNTDGAAVPGDGSGSVDARERDGAPADAEGSGSARTEAGGEVEGEEPEERGRREACC